VDSDWSSHLSGRSRYDFSLVPKIHGGRVVQGDHPYLDLYLALPFGYTHASQTSRLERGRP